MRISVVSPVTTFHRETPPTRRFQTVIEGLDAKGNDVTVLTTPWGTNSTTGELEIEGITYRWIGNGEDDTRGFALGAAKALRSYEPDIVHAMGDRGSLYGAVLGGKLVRIPVLMEWYDGPTADNWVTNLALNRPNRTIAPSRLVKRRLRERDIEGDSIRVIPTAIDLERIYDIQPDDRAQIVYADRLDEAANLETLLLGLAELRDFDWSATIIGEGPQRETYEAQAGDLRIEDRVTFIGDCDRDERIGIYRGAHVFVQSATRCSFPDELLWALAAGCVGIVEYHADSSAHELVEGRKRGFRTTTPQEMADAIDRAGRQEHRTVDETFRTYDEKAVIDRYLECYSEATTAQGLW